MQNPEDDDVALHRDQVAGHLRDLVEVAIISDDPEKVGRVWVALDDLAVALRGKRGEVGYVAEVEAHLLACLDGRALPAVAVGPWRLSAGYTSPRTAWKWDDLLRAVVVKAREDATGELEAPEPRHEALQLSGGERRGLLPSPQRAVRSQRFQWPWACHPRA